MPHRKNLTQQLQGIAPSIHQSVTESKMKLFFLYRYLTKVLEFSVTPSEVEVRVTKFFFVPKFCNSMDGTVTFFNATFFGHNIYSFV